MYDLNLSVPNITSIKYSDDNKFALLQNYLYELNEVLSFALSDKAGNEVQMLYDKAEKVSNESKINAIRLKKESIEKFNSLREQIIRTADEIQKEYTSSVSHTKEEILSSVSSEYATKSEVGELKSETETKILQNSDSISLITENVDSLSDDMNVFRESARSEITMQSEAIMSQVEDIFLTKNEGYELENRVSSQITQTVKNVTENFSDKLSVVNGDIENVGESVSEFVSSLDVYIRRGELEPDVFGIEIGRSDSNVKARFTNDRLSFFQGVAEVAYISGSSLYITNADVLDFLRIGDSSNGYFLFDTTRFGLEVRWIDGD